jgi:hypothetical protein
MVDEYDPRQRGIEGPHFSAQRLHRHRQRRAEPRTCLLELQRRRIGVAQGRIEDVLVQIHAPKRRTRV